MTKPKVYDAIRGFVDMIDNAVLVVGCAMLFALMLIVVADVSLRYIFNAPIQWAYEVVSSYLMPGLFFFAVSHTLKAHAHVSVDIVHNYISRRGRYVFEAIATLVSIPAFAICTWVSARNTMLDFTTAAESTSGLAVPTWTISIMLPIGFGLLTIRLILNAIGYMGTLASGRELLALPPIAGTEETAQ
jgi:TRAP-type C4-dicarboxylate transport system permease small subunit